MSINCRHKIAGEYNLQMQYLTNSQLKDQYGVSYDTVRKWIERASAGRLDLQLIQHSGKPFVANTAQNALIIEGLVVQGKKYKNSRAHRAVTPVPEFYDLYTRKQIFDIITNIDIHREIPRQYNYFDGGATFWDEYATRLQKEKNANILNRTIELVHSNLSNIDRLLEGYTRVNVVDIGPGNCLPIKELLAHLQKRGVLARYIAVDISDAMLDIAENHIKNWFNGTVNFERHIRDISYERFDDVLIEETLREDAATSVNLVLVFGGTLANLRAFDDALKVIYNSMGSKDILLYSKKLDSEVTRRTFDFNTGERFQSLPPQYKLIVDMLGIDESLYEVEQGYNIEEQARFLKIVPKIALTLTFKFAEGERHVELNKGEPILVWRAWHQTAPDIVNQFKRTNFELLQASTSQDRKYLFMASAINRTPRAV